MIKAVIIDDEANCITALLNDIKMFCPNVTVSGVCNSAREGMMIIQKYRPDLIFLDVEMPRMNGFEMLEQFSEIPFAVIFTTGYDQYAIKAIRYFSSIKKCV